MPLDPGTSLGPYEIQSPLGAGGMGEVYKARDTRLDRTVAIKVLPEHVATDPDLKARFEREARTVAALSHPHICPVFDVGEQEGVNYLVMEHLDGETLAERLEKGALPLDQALQIAIEIADALDKAHWQGIVHRDLKPGNIMLTKAGAKLLDFGLAKLKPVDISGGETALPTRSEHLTSQGAILGTLQYMAPEQLEGKEADARTDIFAFGAVVYEMVTGKRAFEGESQASLIAAILDREPEPISSVGVMSSPSLARLVTKCLSKDPEDRWQSARDVTTESQWVAKDGADAVAQADEVPGRRSWVPWGGFAVMTLSTILLAALYTGRPRAPTEAIHLSVSTEARGGGGVALSPNGRQLAFASQGHLWIRSVDAVDAIALPGTELGMDPFWSPDGRAIGFFTPTELKTMTLSGGLPQLVCVIRGVPWGGAWSEGDVIVFGLLGTGLWQISAEGGGDPTLLTAVHDVSPDRPDLVFPQFLPDGEHILFIANQGTQPEAEAYVTSLESGEARSLHLHTTSMVRYAPPGYLVFGRGTTLLAQPFDLHQQLVMGSPVRVDADIVSNPIFDFDISTSRDGGLAYVNGRGGEVSQLRWVNRAGTDLGSVGGVGDYFDPALSPDETRVAVERDADIWLLDVTGDTEQRLTFDPGRESSPVWSPDGTRIIFTNGDGDLYEKDVTGSRPAQLLVESAFRKIPSDWSANGEFVLYSTTSAEASWDLSQLHLSSERQAVSLIQTPFRERAGMLSPDGHWMAYESSEFGNLHVYVQPMPLSGGQWQISRDVALAPRWRGDGRELYFVSPSQGVMAVDIEANGDSLDVGTPEPLFRLPLRLPRETRNAFDVTSDGQRFLVNTVADENAPTITWIHNWIPETEE